MGNNLAQKILDYWFGTSPLDTQELLQPKLSFWFGGSAQTDRDITFRFKEAFEQETAHPIQPWEKSAQHRLAQIIFFDQFSRNIYRDTATAYARDFDCVKLATDLVEKGLDRQLKFIEQIFAYLPFEHAEDKSMQATSVGLFEQWAQKAPPELTDLAQQILEYAINHQKVILEFGRFPHRNAVLGRKSTPRELKFLKTKGRGF